MIICKSFKFKQGLMESPTAVRSRLR